MASRKEYEMLFSLNARMNGGFSGTFSKAQAEFSRLGKEITSLQRLQGDVASYQKQQSAIDATRSKLENLKQQHDLLQKEISETAEGTASLEREKLKLEQRIKDTEAALGRQEQRLESTGARLKEAGVDTSNLSQKDAELTAKIKELRDEQDKAADSADDFGEKAAQAISATGQALASAGIAVALKEIADAFVECVGVAADFEQTMSTVEALSQANARDMAALTAEAKELGATTKFTAKEAGDAMGYMAMAGWDAQDMLQGMNGVLQLAAASGEDLAMVSDIVTDSLSAFGLTAKDTAHFSDVLAAAATNSNTNVAVMGETFKMSASVAGALGYSIEDVAVAMGLMANSGVKGSIAGTALRNTFNGLLEGVTLTGAAFGEYEYSAVRADGTMKDFGSTIDELRVYFERMTEAERVNNAQAIAGQRGYNGLLAILNATDADYASLTASINNCSGAAERMAAIKMDNLNGQLTLMNSAWDALKTTIGEELMPEMRGLYEIGTDIFSGINEFVRDNPGVVKGIAAGAAVIGGVALALTGYAAAAKIAAAASALLSAAIPGVNVIMGVTAAVAGITAAVVAMDTATNASVPSVKELTEAARDMRDAMEDAGDTYAQTTTQTMAAAQAAGLYIDKLEEIEAATGGNVAGNQEYHNILALLTRTVPELADSINLTTDSIDGGTEALRAHTEAWKKDAETQAYQEYINSLYDQYGAVMEESAENSIKLTQAKIKEEAATKGLEDTYQKLLTALGMTDEQFHRTYSSVADIPYRAVSADVAALRTEYLNYQTQLSTAQKEQRNLNKAIEEDASAVAAAAAEIESATAAVEQLTGVTQEQTEAEAEAARQTQLLNGVIGETMEQVASLAAAYEDAYDAALDSISGQYALWDEAEKVVATSAGNINKAMESQIAYWQEYNANLESLGDRAGDIEGLSDLIASFADGSTDSVNAIAGMAKASDEELRAMVQNWQDLQQAQAEASEAIAGVAVDLAGQMDEFQRLLVEDIEAMDLGDEAANSGIATIQGYIDGASGMLAQVKAAYRNIAEAAQNELSIFGATATLNFGAYAAGTESAAPGLALVGERGPELVMFNGGEKVLNAMQTTAVQDSLAANALQVTSFAPVFMDALQAHRALDATHAVGAAVSVQGSAPIQISAPVSITVEGDASPETVSLLERYGSEFEERVLDVLEKAVEERARRAYR